MSRDLKELGLDGIEAYYPEHSEGETREYLDIAKRLDLLISGGSDFHGSIKPDLKLGSGFGALRIPYSLLEAMKHRLHRRA